MLQDRNPVSSYQLTWEDGAGGAAFSGVASRAEVGTGSRRRGATEGFRLSSVPEKKKRYTMKCFFAENAKISKTQ